MEFVRLEYDNNKLTTAELNGHQEIIREYREKDINTEDLFP